MAYAWPSPDAWWRRARTWFRARVPHVHLWRSRTVTISAGMERYDAEERSCRCGDRHVVGAPPPGPSPLIRCS